MLCLLFVLFREDGVKYKRHTIYTKNYIRWEKHDLFFEKTFKSYSVLLYYVFMAIAAVRNASAATLTGILVGGYSTTRISVTAKYYLSRKYRISTRDWNYVTVSGRRTFRGCMNSTSNSLVTSKCYVK